MRLFLCGDVMIGRGIDQIMENSCDPVLYETYVRSALRYVELAERASGPIPRMVAPDYVWGDALRELDRRRPDLRIVNLETSVTASGAPEEKEVTYRTHPKNLGCLSAAKIDCCVLANNHVADWGMAGLVETLDRLGAAGIATAGAGETMETAERPAILPAPNGKRTLVFALACPSSGVPRHWAAGASHPGVNLMLDFREPSIQHVLDRIDAWRRPGDLVVVSIHWGWNWGYDIPAEHRRFAHALIDTAGADVIHGHSSHHPVAIEVHHGRPILYGCGDFINDYEGIRGHEQFRPNLALAYFPDFDDGDHRLREFEMVPFRSKQFRLERTSHGDAEWLARTLDHESRRFGHHVRLTDDGVLGLFDEASHPDS